MERLSSGLQVWEAFPSACITSLSLMHGIDLTGAEPSFPGVLTRPLAMIYQPDLHTPECRAGPAPCSAVGCMLGHPVVLTQSLGSSVGLPFTHLIFSQAQGAVRSDPRFLVRRQQFLVAVGLVLC